MLYRTFSASCIRSTWFMLEMKSLRMPHNYRYLSPAEIQFYGLRASARFITTRKLRYQINGRALTIPQGFIADGFSILEEDFCVQPAWLAFEYVYATHKFDFSVADRALVDIFMYNHYPECIQIVDDELVLG